MDFNIDDEKSKIKGTLNILNRNPTEVLLICPKQLSLICGFISDSDLFDDIVKYELRLKPNDTNYFYYDVGICLRSINLFCECLLPDNSEEVCQVQLSDNDLRGFFINGCSFTQKTISLPIIELNRTDLAQSQMFFKDNFKNYVQFASARIISFVIID